MESNSTVSIDAIHRAVAALDPSGELKGISYNLTQNNTLEPLWWIFTPYGSWPQPQSLPNPSPLENALLSVVKEGLENAETCFIDVLNLLNSNTVFSEGDAESVTATLATYINGLPYTATPIIRYLVGGISGAPVQHAVGSSGPNDRGFPVEDDDLITSLIKAKINHPNAQLYYGNFTPRIGLKSVGSTGPAESSLCKIWHWILQALHIEPKPTQSHADEAIDAAISGIWDWILKELQKFDQEIYNELIKLKAIIETFLHDFIAVLAAESPQFSWNHAKIFAVNGTHLVSGLNFFTVYGRDHGCIFDTGMVAEGAVAGDAHRFANYLWQYLGNIPDTDKNSWSVARSLSYPNPDPNMGWTYVGAPLFTDFKPGVGTIGTLSVGKNGLRSIGNVEVPLPAFDAVRDFMLNIIDALVQARFSTKPFLSAYVANLLDDTNPDFRDLLKSLGINPAGWASRYARNYAIGHARKSLRFDQQTFVMEDLLASSSYQTLLQQFNQLTGCNWNGFIWPFDTLLALGYALSAMSWESDPPAKGVHIICSYYQGPSAPISYGDTVTASEFKDRLVGFMEGMVQAKYILPNGTPKDIVARYVSYKRINVDATTCGTAHGNHSKMMIVDDTACYIGSDNMYPSYNQEFGIWVDDLMSVKNLIADYWDGLWEFAQPDSP